MTETQTIQTAVALATSTAQKATDVANTAAKVATELASKTAESNGVINTNMEWIKKGLGDIQLKLDQMDKAFVTAAQHQEVLNAIDGHEKRICKVETTNTRLNVLISIGIGILSILVGMLVYHLFQS